MVDEIEKNIKNLIAEIIDRIKNSTLVENQHFELKRQWPKYTSRDIEISEFLSVITGMVNDLVKEGYLIYGIDETSGDIYDMPITTFGFKDEVDLRNKINAEVSPLFSYDIRQIVFDDNGTKKVLSVFLLKPSNCWHELKAFYPKNGKDPIQHRIFIRKGSQTVVASAQDINEKFSRLGFIEPDEPVKISISDGYQDVGMNINTGPVEFLANVTLENKLNKEIAIKYFKVIIPKSEEHQITRDIIFSNLNYWENRDKKDFYNTGSYRSKHPLVIPAKSIVNRSLNITGGDGITRPEHSKFQYAYRYIIECYGTDDNLLGKGCFKWERKI